MKKLTIATLEGKTVPKGFFAKMFSGIIPTALTSVDRVVLNFDDEAHVYGAVAEDFVETGKYEMFVPRNFEMPESFDKETDPVKIVKFVLHYATIANESDYDELYEYANGSHVM